MPTRDEIQQEILVRGLHAQDWVRRKYFADIQEYTQRDTIVYATAAFTSVKVSQLTSASQVSITLEDIQGFMAALHNLKNKNLDLILHSPGGSLEAAEQIVQYLRSKYDHIRAIVPQSAMSAATMIACACDVIVMGKHSAIGPIDPQVTLGNWTAPAFSYREEFNQAKAEVAADPHTAPLWLAKIQQFPPGFLHQCDSAISLSKEKVAGWLDAYMFKELPADQKIGQKIADWLGEAKIHKTHGRPIGISTAREIGLKVEALEDDQQLQEKVLSLFHSVAMTFENTTCYKFIENHQGKGWFQNLVPVTR